MMAHADEQCMRTVDVIVVRVYSVAFGQLASAVPDALWASGSVACSGGWVQTSNSPRAHSRGLGALVRARDSNPTHQPCLALALATVSTPPMATKCNPLRSTYALLQALKWSTSRAFGLQLAYAWRVRRCGSFGCVLYGIICERKLRGRHERSQHDV